ncbi:peptidoglycan recognition protein family protein [Tumebacillus permanentifrigoris]|uniref:N-acetylmuramoyl-L-alanine amidase n=1 Tax=Tumebacillus permanentifrigoris TaxID=378543 RepID=A0A316DAB1_9BACL|nr:N-acetylmuramoyl-L-alanine amidase [Tumebacillus permanentifrigoris]PWK14435.1 N-acetylmuramoyl-L-alanine amidase [Tumebacillus permanentifrigoris]
MKFSGIVLHDSGCPNVRSKAGYDFFVGRDGLVTPSNDFTDDDHLHVCVEGDFDDPIPAEEYLLVREQMFTLVKLVLRLASLFEFDPQSMSAHGDTCPGEEFPWHDLKVRIGRPPH